MSPGAGCGRAISTSARPAICSRRPIRTAERWCCSGSIRRAGCSRRPGGFARLARRHVCGFFDDPPQADIDGAGAETAFAVAKVILPDAAEAFGEAERL